ncbi:RWD domain-containing protein 2B [Electrophorus electricus]|uniref:RWD domain-containing protein n=1 Tax=Electrophorus electricus TaxID=8005 RepID=A0AAY5ENM3_ELEEL|nr:RWD domain-containing protein 2B [Electrophorus electricus]
MACPEEAEAQLAEIELMRSMFPSEDEFVFDQLAHAELGAYVEGTSDTPPSTRPEFSIKLKVDTSTIKETNITLSCTYPFNYPKVLPEIAVRCTELSRAQQSRLVARLTSYLRESCSGDVCALSAVEWLKDHALEYLSKSATCNASEKETAAAPTKETFTRLWIYSHHIYNKSKRKNILEWAKEMKLSGFCMPGKPGIVCVEGLHPACEAFWARVKVLTWKRIMIRHREDVPLDPAVAGSSETEKVDSLRRFAGFEEAIFDPHGNRGNHMDLGQLFQFLSDRGCGEIFQLYFGVEGR